MPKRKLIRIFRSVTKKNPLLRLGENKTSRDEPTSRMNITEAQAGELENRAASWKVTENSEEEKFKNREDRSGSYTFSNGSSGRTT